MAPTGVRNQHKTGPRMLRSRPAQCHAGMRLRPSRPKTDVAKEPRTQHRPPRFLACLVGKPVPPWMGTWRKSPSVASINLPIHCPQPPVVRVRRPVPARGSRPRLPDPQLWGCVIMLCYDHPAAAQRSSSTVSGHWSGSSGPDVPFRRFPRAPSQRLR